MTLFMPRQDLKRDRIDFIRHLYGAFTNSVAQLTDLLFFFVVNYQ